MQYFPTKKITVSVDKKSNKPSSIYLIYDMNFKNQTLLQRPENYYIKILLLFSISADGQYIICDFGIPELLFPGITSSYIFYLYACFSSTDSTKSSISTQKFEKIVHSEVYKLNTAEIVHVQLPIVPYFCDKNQLNNFSQIPVECIFSIVPFVFPFYKPKLRLLPTILFSFINLIPQITEYHSNWPLVSWIRQMQYSGDASVYNLYDILFPDKEIDLSTICQGLKHQKKVQNTTTIPNNSNNLSSILYNNSPITDASIDSPGLSYSQIKKIVFKLTRLISLELGFSYHLFSMEPTYDMQSQGNPELLVFCPSFGVKYTILTEILCNGKLYTLHSVVREEEGNITATVYSPFTKILYDIRNGQVFPLNRQHPPLCNVNEQYIMLLYAHEDVNRFFSQKAHPISPFFPRYPLVNVYECKLGQKVPNTPKKVESISLDFDAENVYFAFDPDMMPFPAIPLEEVCGKAVLQFDRKDFLSPTMLIWHAKREDQRNINNSNITGENKNDSNQQNQSNPSKGNININSNQNTTTNNNNSHSGNISFNSKPNLNISFNSSSNSLDSNNNDNDSEQDSMRNYLRNLIKTGLSNSNKNFGQPPSDINPCKISFVPFAHRLAKGHEIIKENPNLTFAVIQDHCIATFFNAENDADKEISKLENSLPMNNTVCFDKEVLQFSNDSSCTKYLNISFTKNKISDKYIYFVGNPLLLLINTEIHYDSIINNLKSLYNFDHVYIKQKNAWAEIDNSGDFRNAAETMKYVDLLIQLN